MGNIFFVNASPNVFALVEGLAAGRLFQGGAVVGMSTLCGFLTAIFFKTLEV
ncbi:MAG: hypothetical protein MI756_10430 [Chromatiales bacterium]|nr:hypothetical protein [Chromatiales bacterium]